MKSKKIINYSPFKGLKLEKVSPALLLTSVSKREMPRPIWNLLNEA